MKKQKNQNPLELMAELESVVINTEEANENKNLDGIKSARKEYFNILRKCFDIPKRTIISGETYGKVAETLSKLDDRFSNAVKPYLMQIYFPTVCRRNKKQ